MQASCKLGKAKDHVVFMDLEEDLLVDVRYTQFRISKGLEETQLLLAVKRIGRKSPSLLSLSPKCLRLAESSRPDDQAWKGGLWGQPV